MRVPMAGLVLGIAVLAVSCAVKVPEVQVGGSGSALEEQVSGVYESIGSYDVVTSRAVGTPLTRKPPTPEVKAAYARQQQRASDLALLKRAGVVGEDNRGQLLLRGTESLPDGWTAARVETLVRDENADRKTIADWIATSNVRLSLTPRSKIDAALARMYQEQSPPGTWIQTEDGSWKQKE